MSLTTSYRAAAGLAPELFDRGVEDVYVAIGKGMKELEARKQAYSQESLPPHRGLSE